MKRRLQSYESTGKSVHHVHCVHSVFSHLQHICNSNRKGDSNGNDPSRPVIPAITAFLISSRRTRAAIATSSGPIGGCPRWHGPARYPALVSVTESAARSRLPQQQAATQLERTLWTKPYIRRAEENTGEHHPVGPPAVRFDSAFQRGPVL